VQVSAISVNMSKKITYLESYHDFGPTSSQHMMFKNINASFIPKCLVMVPLSRQSWKLHLLRAFPHMYVTAKCHCRRNALDFVLQEVCLH